MNAHLPSDTNPGPHDESSTVDELRANVARLEQELLAAREQLERQATERAGELGREQVFAAFARIGADWFWLTDPEGRFVYFSGADEHTDPFLNGRIGRTRRESAAQDPENVARIDALDELIARRESFRDFLYSSQIGDEPGHWCTISGEPVFDAGGAFQGYRGIGRNVTELVETQIALQTKTRILDGVLAAMPDAIRVLGPDGRTLSVNDQFYSLFQFDRETMQAAPDPLWYSLFEMARRGEYGPGDPAELARARYVLLGTDTFHYERHLTHGPWIEARGVPLEGGGRLSIYREITERVEAEQALRDLNATLEQRIEERTAALAESERFNRATLDSIEARVAVIDGKGQIVATNVAWRRFAETSRSDWHAAGDRANYLAACDGSTDAADGEARAVGAAIRDIVAGRLDSFEVEYPLLTVEGERHFLCRVARVGSDGPVRLVITHSDVSVVRLAEQQARRAQRLEAIGTLAGGIAHDLNNALTPIMMGLDVLSTDSPRHRGTIEMMLASANHGAEMLKQLLTFARGAEGQRMMVQPALLFDDVQRIAQGTFPKSIRLSSWLAPNVSAVQGDPTQLHQVLLNLCVNARDAMPDGGTLSLEAEVVSVGEALARTTAGARPGVYVRLRVCDTGTGIEAGVLDRIFDPFFTTKTLDLGTGLGLSTALGIVKAHGGFIQVHSRPGQGSTFSVYLPTAGPAVEVGGSAKTLQDGESIVQGRGRLILVVDDEPAIRQLYRVVLGRMGFSVVTAEDGADGLEQAERHHAELSAVITDVRMPNMDGLGLIRALRERDITVPLAIATGRIEDRQVDELDQLGVTARLSKPFTQRRLTAVLRQLLGRDDVESVGLAAG